MNLPPLLLVLFGFKQLLLPWEIKAGRIMWQSERSHRDVWDRGVPQVTQNLLGRTQVSGTRKQYWRLGSVTEHLRTSEHLRMCREEHICSICDLAAPSAASSAELRHPENLACPR